MPPSEPYDPASHTILVIHGKGRNSEVPWHVVLPNLDPPERLPEGTHILHASFPSADERHIAFGEFITEWDKLEHLHVELIQKLFGVNRDNAKIIIAGMTPQSLRQAMAQAGALSLSQPRSGQLNVILDRCAKATTKRNRLIHGEWVLEAIVNILNKTPTLQCRWARHGSTPTREIESKLEDLRNTKERSAYCFQIDDIRSFALTIKAIRKDLAAYAE